MDTPRQPPEVHPICLLLPDMDADQFASLKDDIEKHGLIRPILLFEGKILDGRHRARACDELGVDAQFENWSGDDPVSFVLSENLYRRHLSASQRALIAAQAMDHHKALADARMKAGKTLASNDARPPLRGKAAGTAAAAAGVSQALVERALRIVKDGTPDDVLEVGTGEATVTNKVREITSRQATPHTAGKPQQPSVEVSVHNVGYLKSHVAQARHLAKVAKGLSSKIAEYSHTPIPVALAALEDIRATAEKLTKALGKIADAGAAP